MSRGATLRLAVLGVVAVLLVLRVAGTGRVASSRSGMRGGEGTGSTKRETTQDRAALMAPVANDSLLRGITGSFVDGDGRTRSLAEFRGAPWVASAIYTRCATVCPRVVAALKRFDRVAGHDPAPRYVLFSLDPAHDTPGELRAFAIRHELESARWTLLAPSAEALPGLTAALGVASSPDAEGGLAHSAVVAMVGSEGTVRARRVGLDLPAEALVAMWRRASRRE